MGTAEALAPGWEASTGICERSAPGRMAWRRQASTIASQTGQVSAASNRFQSQRPAPLLCTIHALAGWCHSFVLSTHGPPSDGDGRLQLLLDGDLYNTCIGWLVPFLCALNPWTDVGRGRVQYMRGLEVLVFPAGGGNGRLQPLGDCVVELGDLEMVVGFQFGAVSPDLPPASFADALPFPAFKRVTPDPLPEARERPATDARAKTTDSTYRHATRHGGPDLRCTEFGAAMLSLSRLKPRTSYLGQEGYG